MNRLLQKKRYEKRSGMIEELYEEKYPESVFQLIINNSVALRDISVDSVVKNLGSRSPNFPVFSHFIAVFFSRF